MRKYTRTMALLSAVACLLSSHALAQNAPVTLRLEPDTVAAGEAATLAVTTANSARPQLPEVAGASIQPVGTQSSVTVTNGVTQQSSTFLYAVTATQPGDYTIAGIRSGDATAAPVTLHVTPAGATAAQRAPRAATRKNDARLAFMRLSVKPRRMYSGQSVPFVAKAFFRGGTGVTVRGRPELSSDAFTVNGLDDEPAQTETTIDGVPYLAVTWRGSITAVKPGKHRLEMTLPVSMQYREATEPAPASPAPRRRSLRDLFGGAFGSSLFGTGSPFDSMLDDPFFDSAFDQPMFSGLASLGRVVTRDIDLHGRAGTADVLALPSHGRPDDYSGAVGHFELDAQLAEASLVQGEPADLTYTLRGEGNFGQFSAPTLEASPAWKAYSPQSSFTPSDKTGLRGSMSYRQPIAAERSGALSLPALRFSYFDPDAQRYVTKTAQALSVQVAPAPGYSGSPDRAAQSDLGTTQRASSSSDAPTAVDAISVRSLAHGGVPGWLVPGALSLLSLAAFGSLLIALLRSERVRRSARRVRARRELARKRRTMRRAMRQGDQLGYLRAGRDVLRRRLGASWGVPPQSISIRELDARWPQAPQPIRELLERADEAEYSGADAPRDVVPDFASWAHKLDRQLAHMEVPS